MCHHRVARSEGGDRAGQGRAVSPGIPGKQGRIPSGPPLKAVGSLPWVSAQAAAPRDVGGDTREDTCQWNGNGNV